MIAAACTGGGPEVVAATAASSSLAVLAYGALFLCLGLRVQRALVWGLAYILLWEGFVAEFGVTPARVAIRTYAGSLLAAVSDEVIDVFLSRSFAVSAWETLADAAAEYGYAVV